MEIHVTDNSLRKAISDEAACKKRFGMDMAKKISLRLAALRAANSLADFWPPKSGPERCHELQGKLAGKFSIDLKQPYRLLFIPIGENVIADVSDERERWQSITSIDIIGIEDTHG
jgi:proteic killer suppression protein